VQTHSTVNYVISSENKLPDSLYTKHISLAKNTCGCQVSLVNISVQGRLYKLPVSCTVSSQVYSVQTGKHRCKLFSPLWPIYFLAKAHFMPVYMYFTCSSHWLFQPNWPGPFQWRYTSWFKLPFPEIKNSAVNHTQKIRHW